MLGQSVLCWVTKEDPVGNPVAGFLQIWCRCCHPSNCIKALKDWLTGVLLC